MAERQSPLAALSAIGRPGGSLRLSHRTPAAILQVAAWPETLASVEAVIGGVIGIRAPRAGRASSGGDVAILSFAPGRFLVACDTAGAAANLRRVLPPSNAALTDLGHGRAILRLEGPEAADVLAKGVALDLHLAAFPPGRGAATAIHHIDVVIHRREAQVFDLWVLRGFAEALAEWLLDAGLEFGIALQPG